MTADEIRQLADLESREVLLAKLAGAMKASLNNAAYLFAAPLAKAVRTMEALRQKLEDEAPAAAAAPVTEDAPAADDAPVADDAEAPAVES
jgi:large subunit ribosomal protein L10